MELINRIRNFGRMIIEYNVFDTNSTDESIIHIQRWSTRLYVLILWLAMMILLFYTTLHVSSTQIKIKNPSLSTYLNLYDQHQNIECPCTQLSTSYAEFVQLLPTYNQICSSEFISDEWIQFLFDNNQTTSRYAADFRATASQQFQTLRELCQLSIRAVENGLQTLYNSQLISGQLLSKNLFEAELEADIRAFQRITTSNFWSEFTLVRSLVFGNELMPAVETAFTIIVRSDTPGVIRSSPGVNTNLFRQSDGSECGCTDYASCHMSAGLYDITTFDTSRGIFDQEALPPRENIFDWYTGCWPSETLLLSTLGYLYNQTALSRIVTYVNSSVADDYFIALKTLQNSSFELNTTIEMLVEELFVEMWSKALNYTAYFQQCQPETCVFDINQRASALYIVTSLLGLYGGLSVVLLVITPFVITFIMKRIRRRQINVAVQHPEPADSPHTFRGWIEKLWHLFTDLNLFKSTKRVSPTDQQHQRWSTRLYITCLAVAILFLTLYTWLSAGLKIIQIQNPSQDTVEHLQLHASSLQCPCTELSISYEDLIDLEPTYHQICSSEFIASKWIDGLNEIASLSVESLYYADFRFSSPTFQLLNSMCDLANETVINALFVLGQTQLVTANLITPDLFSEQLESAIAQFKLTTPNALLRLLQLTRNITYMNQFLSGSYANFFVDYSLVQQYAQPNTTIGIYGSTSVLPNGTTQSCSCANNIECGMNAALYTGPSGYRVIIFTVPGFYSRCFPVESLLPSTLECFYSNSPCLDIMANITNQSFFTTMNRLNASQPSRFMTNTTINDLLDQLFIESWSSTLFYISYFNKCQPAYCSYTVITQKSTIEIVTTVTGLIGGLSIAFRFLIPYFILACIKLFRKHHTSQTNVRHPQRECIQDNLNVRNKFKLLFILAHNNILQTTGVRQKIHAYVVTLNMFEKAHRTAVDEFELYLQRQSTRVYFLLLLLALFILVVYTSLIYQQNNDTINISSVEKFQHLQDLYGSTTVECPCTQISFNRATFYQMEPVFHQVCSSDFISIDWLNTLFTNYGNQNSSETQSFTFNGTAFAYFQSLHIMCDLTKQAVIDAQDLFLATQVVSAYMVDYGLFDRQTTAALTSFQSTLSDSFVHILQMILGMAQGNGLVSGYSTNWGVFLPNMTKDATIYTKARIYAGCNCATSALCTQSSIPYVPGFVVGCLPLQSFLRSTFECLYDQSCVDMMSFYVNASIVPRALNYTNTRFGSNLTANEIVGEMFIESWSSNISYENFFQQCQPTSCSYTLIGRNNVLYVITTIVGLYGGLTVLLKLVVPLCVHHIYPLLRRRRTNSIQVAAIQERH